VNRELIFRNISHLFPEAEIALFLRNQIDFIVSLYTQSIKGGNYKKLEESLTSYSLLNFKTPYMLKELNLNIESLDFNTLNTILHTYIEKSKIHYFFYENIAKDSASFFISTFNTLGIKLNIENIEFDKKVNRSLTLKQTKFLRVINRFLTSLYNPLGILTLLSFNKISSVLVLKLIRKYNTRDYKNKIEVSDFLDKEKIKVLKEFYRTKNKIFVKNTGIELPEKYFY